VISGDHFPVGLEETVRWRTWQVVEDVLKPIVFASMIIAVIVFDSEAKAFVYFQF